MKRKLSEVLWTINIHIIMWTAVVIQLYITGTMVLIIESIDGRLLCIIMQLSQID